MATNLDQALLDAMVPVMHAAERTEALIKRRLGSRFRIADYTIYGEVALNRVLAMLLNPNGDHGQGDLFLASFIRMLGLPWPIQGRWSVVANYRTMSGRYVDLALINSPFVAIYVESKPWANEGIEQLADYAKDLLAQMVQDRLLVFLPGHEAREPQTLSAEMRARLGERAYQKIPFQRGKVGQSIVEWLDQVSVRARGGNSAVSARRA